MIIDGLIFAGVMGATCAVGSIAQTRREKKEMKARHAKRFEEIKRNNRSRLINEIKIDR